VTRTIITAVVALLLAGVLPNAVGAGQTPTAENPIQRENALAGTTAWQARLSGRVEQYGTQITAAPGDEVDLHVSTTDRYRIDVYRLGWYAGSGARLVTCLPSCTTDEQGRRLQRQPGPAPPSPTDPPIRADWAVTDVLRTGSDWASGYYIAEATLTNGPDNGRVATTYFIVREPAGGQASRILVQVPVNTWQAYNRWGGKSLYDFYGPRMYRVSFERPFGEMAQSPLWWELPLVRFLEREGYDVSYRTDVDTDSNPGSLLQHRLVMVAGHDEYWTSAIRDAFDNALADGTNLAFMGANEGY
jgi:N,N-dimethylformamidase beta subunit-like, C-terminal